MPLQTDVMHATRPLALLAALASAPAAAQQTTDGHDFDACEAPALSLPGQAEEAKKAVVTVIANRSVGAAVISSSEGVAVTAAHVVGLSDAVRVRTSQGLELEAKVIARDEAKDLALIDIAGGGHPCARFAETPAPLGADVYAIGAPLGQALSFSVSRGIISGFPTLTRGSMVQTDASISPGNSGGPLLSADGLVQGIVSGKAVDNAVEGIAFAVPAQIVRRTFGPGTGTIGAGSARANVPMARMHIKTDDKGVVVGVPKIERYTVSNNHTNGLVTYTELVEVCKAPCDLNARPGTLVLEARAPKRDAVRKEFTLDAGEEVTYDLRMRSPIGSMAGGALLTAGVITAFFGQLHWVSPTDPQDYQSGKRTFFVGATAAVASVPLFVSSRSVWRKVPAPKPAPAAPAPVAPAPAAPAPTP